MSEYRYCEKCGKRLQGTSAACSCSMNDVIMLYGCPPVKEPLKPIDMEEMLKQRKYTQTEKLTDTLLRQVVEKLDKIIELLSKPKRKRRKL